MQIQLDRIQGNITPGFRKDVQELLFLEFPSAAAGRAWVADMVDTISTAQEVAEFNQEYRRIKASGADPRTVQRRTVWRSLAFTSVGLRLLRPAWLPPDAKGAFAEGMADRAVRILGDDREARCQWTVGKAARPVQSSHRKVHALLILGGDSHGVVNAERTNTIDPIRRRHGVEVVHRVRGETLGGGEEHFGFRDAVSQPDPEDPLAGWDWAGNENIVAPGELILGYPDESSGDGAPASCPSWQVNGSFLAYRQLRQHVGAFRAAMRAAGEQIGLSEQELAARVMGRWQSGAKLQQGQPGGTCPVAWNRDDAVYTGQDYRDDPHGWRVPLFSHVRQANARIQPGVAAGTPEDAAATRELRSHRIIRRGITYGPKLPQGVTSDDNRQRGVLFLAYQASLERGFEFVQRWWFSHRNWPTVAPRTSFPATEHDPGTLTPYYPGLDPMVGRDDREDRTVWYHRPDQQGAFERLDLPRFVTVEDGAYFFTPSIDSLRLLAQPA